MAPYPFQHFPTFVEYCGWLRGKGGKTSKGDNRWGRFTVLVSPDGQRTVTEAGTGDDEVLTPTTVERLDTRLGLKSPWHPQFDDYPDD